MIQELTQGTDQLQYHEVTLSDDTALRFERDLDGINVKHVDYITFTETTLCSYRYGIWIMKATIGNEHKLSLFWNFVKTYPKKANRIIKNLLPPNIPVLPISLEWNHFRRKLRIQSSKINKALKTLN